MEEDWYQFVVRRLSSQLCVKNINVVYLSRPRAASNENRERERERKKVYIAPNEKKKQFEAGTKGIRSFLRVNLFSFFSLPLSSNYKVYSFVTYRMQSERKTFLCEKCFTPKTLFLSLSDRYLKSYFEKI